MKQINCNPTPKKGSRNVYCPYYSDCLDKVIQQSWAVWHCHRCEERSNQGARPEMLLNVGYSVAYYELTADV